MLVQMPEILVKKFTNLLGCVRLGAVSVYIGNIKRLKVWGSLAAEKRGVEINVGFAYFFH
jgi:hypothetical protein